MNVEINPRLNIFRVAAEEGEELTIEMRDIPSYKTFTKVSCKQFDIVITKTKARK